MTNEYGITTAKHKLEFDKARQFYPIMHIPYWTVQRQYGTIYSIPEAQYSDTSLLY